MFFLQFGECQQVVGQFDQAVGIAHDHFQVFAAFTRRFFGQGFGVALIGRQRRAQLMGDIGHKVLFLPFQAPGSDRS